MLKGGLKTEVLDLFCGMGGFAQGFKASGFDVTGADISEHAGKTFELNNLGKFKYTDLSHCFVHGDYDVIIGGPPCKPWSAVNTTRRGKKHRDYILISRFFKHVELIRPKVFLLENVPLLAGEKKLEQLIEGLNNQGYSMHGKVVTYSDYGAPTKRHRFVLFGTRLGSAETFFERLSNHTSRYKSVKDVIWKLRDTEKGGFPDHVWPELKTINNYLENYKSNKFGWYVLKWDEPAPSFGNIMKTYILHPDAFNGRPTRVISVREALLIMGFDENVHFPDGLGLGVRYQMIVDSVSPVFSLAAARVVKELIDH